MAAQDLHAFLHAFSSDAALRRHLETVLALAGGSTDMLAIVADFAFRWGHRIDAEDLLALDTALEDMTGRGAQAVVRHLHVFAFDYLAGCEDPQRYNRLGVYDPQRRHLWRAF